LPLLTYSRLGGLRQDPGRAAELAPDQERTKTWGHDVRVLFSTYGGRGDEPLVGLAVRLRALGAEVRVCAPPDRAERSAHSSEGRQREMRMCPTRGSTEPEASLIRSASAVQRSTAASEVSR
jgi:vancomycin aglycone glucosyltransferase